MTALTPRVLAEFRSRWPLWPGSTLEYWWRTRRFDAARYRFA